MVALMKIENVLPIVLGVFLFVSCDGIAIKISKHSDSNSKSVEATRQIEEACSEEEEEEEENCEDDGDAKKKKKKNPKAKDDCECSFELSDSVYDTKACGYVSLDSNLSPVVYGQANSVPYNQFRMTCNDQFRFLTYTDSEVRSKLNQIVDKEKIYACAYVNNDLKPNPNTPIWYRAPVPGTDSKYLKIEKIDLFPGRCLEKPKPKIDSCKIPKADRISYCAVRLCGLDGCGGCCSTEQCSGPKPGPDYECRPLCQGIAWYAPVAYQWYHKTFICNAPTAN